MYTIPNIIKLHNMFDVYYKLYSHHHKPLFHEVCYILHFIRYLQSHILDMKKLSHPIDLPTYTILGKISKTLENHPNIYTYLTD